MQYAFPSIEGTDHQLLLLYYMVLQSIAEDYITYSLTPKEHIKLLRKVKATSPSMQILLLWMALYITKYCTTFSLNYVHWLV
jgi:hypothetical protein